MKRPVYSQVTVNDALEPTFCLVPVEGKPRKNPRVMLVANTRWAAIRVSEISRHEKWRSQAVQWRLIEENFPIGPLMNADTHIFDGSLFENHENKCRFMMVALPKTIVEPIAELGVQKWKTSNRLTRLDVIEHLLFRHYTKIHNTANDKSGRPLDESSNPVNMHYPLWVVFSQDAGLRLLLIDNGLPVSAHYLSEHHDTQVREAELVWGIEAPRRVVFATLDFGEAAFESGRKTAAMPPTWLYEFIRSKGGVEIENEVIQL